MVLPSMMNPHSPPGCTSSNDPSLGGTMSPCSWWLIWSCFAIVSPRSQGSRSTGGTASSNSGEESTKRRRVSSAKQTAESSSSSDDSLTAFPCLVTLNPGIRIASVAAGGRHTLALSGTEPFYGVFLHLNLRFYLLFSSHCVAWFGWSITTMTSKTYHWFWFSESFRYRTGVGLGLWRWRAAWSGFQNTYGFHSSSCSLHWFLLLC